MQGTQKAQFYWKGWLRSFLEDISQKEAFQEKLEKAWLLLITQEKQNLIQLF